ncbi:IS4 family transposase [Bacillus nitratireducens]|uniref:IS4 family transposase n=1 Tax=Bacillus nitratireducens TaxID=2026193 RepID=UPI001BAA7BB3|nr:IS4 family transposase [Bacillus nitratireducens]QUG87162.1 IS4 family transposase [Bacillus nitratireducens]
MNLSIQDEFHLFAEALQRCLSPHILQQLAQETGFVKRKSKYGARDLAALCIWISQQVASDSLTRLCSQICANTATLMSPEGLNQRFNRCAVLFLQRVFSLLIKSKLNDSSQISSQYTSYFQRIRILDATIFQVPNHLASIYPGSGGCAQTAGIKIQLEYDLHSGKFLNFQMEPGKNNDKTFGTECLDTLRPGDLCIRDLGYFSLKDLDQMDQRGVFYVSRLKLNNRVYVKNESPEFFRNGTVKKQSLYVLLNLEDIMHQIKPEDTYEIQNVYIGQQKLPSRVVIYRLTSTQIHKRRKQQTYVEKKKRVTYSEKSKRLTEINVYITNIPWDVVPMEHIHDIYSLRWQIEIVFKTWKSHFGINRCHNVKREHLECHLYGQLIAIFLCSSTMFKMRQLLLQKKQKELSEYKAIYMIQDHLYLAYEALQKGTQEITKVFLHLFNLLQKNGRKSHRYEKKTVFDILGIVYEYSGLRRQKKAA